MKRIILALAVVAAILPASAQTLLVGAEASKKLPAGFSVGAGVEYRTQQWFKYSDQVSIDVNVGWKPIRPLKIAVGYKYISAYNMEATDKAERIVEDYWANKHRLSVSATGELKLFGLLTLSLRERYQYTYRPRLEVPRYDPFEDMEQDGFRKIEAKSKHVLRSRLMAEFKPYRKCRFTPFVSWELYSQLRVVNHDKGDRNEGGVFNDKWRLTAGTDFRINKRNSLSLYYRYCHAADISEGDEPHTIALTYSFKF